MTASWKVCYAAAPSRQPQPRFRPGMFEQKRAIVLQSLSENSQKLHSKNPDENEYANVVSTRSLHTFKEMLLTFHIDSKLPLKSKGGLGLNDMKVFT